MPGNRKRSHPSPKTCLPGQEKNKDLNPFTDHVQTKISIIGFNLHPNFTKKFDINELENMINNFTVENHFFNTRNVKSKKSKGTMHLTTVATEKLFYQAGARCTIVIRPKIHPSTNIHTIQRLFNKSIKNELRWGTIWLKDSDIDKFRAESNMLNLTLRVLQYECEHSWCSENANLPLLDSVEEYKGKIGDGEFEGQTYKTK